MPQYLIMCRSLTSAQSCSKSLERSGINSYVIKAPQELTGGGCGYAVSLRRNPEKAVALLRKNGLLTGKIYRKETDGSYEEVRI